MNHDERAGASVGSIEQIGVAQVERPMPTAFRVQLFLGDGIDTLGRLLVAFLHLGSQFARPPADRVGCKQDVAIVAPHPDLEFMLLLEDPQENGRAHFHTVTRQTLGQVGEIGRTGQRPAEPVARSRANAASWRFGDPFGCIAGAGREHRPRESDAEHNEAEGL